MAEAQPGAHGATITTARLLLRTLRLDDAPDLHAMRSNPEVLKYTPRTPEVDVLSSTEFIKKQLAFEKSWNFVVELRESSYANANNRSLPKVIGICGAHNLPEVGYLWNQSVWGHGYATEALRAFVEAYWKTFPEGFPSLEEDKKDFLLAYSHEENSASNAVLGKAGFKLEEKEQVDHPKMGRHTKYSWRLWRPGMEEGHK